MLTYRFGIIGGLCVASLNLATPAVAQISHAPALAISTAVEQPAFRLKRFDATRLNFSASASAVQVGPAQNATAAAVALPVPSKQRGADPFARTRAAALKWEVAYQVLSAVDAAQTMNCLDRGTCEEANPLWGKHPKKATIILSKALIGAAHFAVFQHLNERSPRTALRLAQISFVGQAGVVALNARFAF